MFDRKRKKQKFVSQNVPQCGKNCSKLICVFSKRRCEGKKEY